MKMTLMKYWIFLQKNIKIKISKTL